MNRFLKNEEGNVMEKVIILCLAGILIIHLFRLVGYIECINNKSMDRVSSAISGLLYEEEPSACKGKSTTDVIDDTIGNGGENGGGGAGGGGTTPGDNTTNPGGGAGGGTGGNGNGSGGTGDGSSGGGTNPGGGNSSPGEDIEYYNYAEVNPTCTPSSFSYPFSIPVDAPINSMGTKTITVTNQSGFDIWVKIASVTPKNNLSITSYNQGYKIFENGQSITFDISWSWSSGSRGAATASLSTTCAVPESSDMYIPSPGAPKNIKTSSTNNSLTISWDAAQYASSYKIVLNIPVGYTNEIVQNGTTSGTSYTFTDLHPGTPYTFTVQSINRTGFSDAVGGSGKTTGVSPLPGAPSELKLVSRTDTSISVSWKAGTNVANYSTVASANGVTGGKPTSTSYTFNNLKPGTSYRISVVSQNSFGNSASVELDITTTGTQLIPSVPSNVKVTSISNTTMKISWSPSARATSYEITSLAHGSRVIYSGTDTYFTVSGLKAKTTYVFGVTAVNAYGKSTSATAYGTTTNVQYNDVDSPSPTACQAGSYTKEYAMPENIKPGNSGKFEIKIANTLKNNVTAIISVSDKVGGYFEGSKPVTLMFDSSPLVVAPDGTGSRTITWSLPSSAGNEYDGQMGSFSALVLLECS